MTLETLYFIAQIIAALAIVGSLVFVGLQMRTQAQQTEIQRTQYRLAESAKMRNTVFDYPELRQIILKANSGLHTLSTDELFLYSSWARRMLLLAQLIYVETDRKRGAAPPRDAAASLARTFLLPGVQELWVLEQRDYEPDFIAFVDELIAWGRKEGFDVPLHILVQQSREDAHDA